MYSGEEFQFGGVSNTAVTLVPVPEHGFCGYRNWTGAPSQYQFTLYVTNCAAARIIDLVGGVEPKCAS